ncbi:MAG: DNA-binding protein [Burkholderia sp.]|nr:DNA-binding protein [Burkholderia sp.]
MRYQGRITSWKDDQGFGFITPNGGGDQVFLHIKSFSSTRRRPAGNEIVTYELTADKNTRLRAANVAFVGKRVVARTAPGTGWAAPVFAAVFFLFLLVGVITGRMPIALPASCFGMSVVAFMMYAHDKSAAKKNARRTEESKLHFIALIGGWPGALLAQRVLRHKTSKQSFQIVFWATVILNVAALLVFLSPTATNIVLTILNR